MNGTFDLTGKVAVVTGGSGVIGRVIAAGLAEAGAQVAVLGLHKERAEAAAAEITAAGGVATGYGADVLNKESMQQIRREVLDEYGRVDILVNGAGGNRSKATTGPEQSFFDIGIEDIRQVFDLNVTGAILTTQVFGEDLVRAGEGCVVNISSMASYLPLTRTVAYSGAKAAVNNFTQWMAVHFNQNYSPKIRVNAVAPGFLLTAQNRFLMLDEQGNNTLRGEKVLEKTPMGRFGEPRELVGAILWLCSESASFVNGAIIPIDGGFSAYWGV